MGWTGCERVPAMPSPSRPHPFAQTTFPWFWCKKKKKKKSKSQAHQHRDLAVHKGHSSANYMSEPSRPLLGPRRRPLHPRAPSSSLRRPFGAFLPSCRRKPSASRLDVTPEHVATGTKLAGVGGRQAFSSVLPRMSFPPDAVRPSAGFISRAPQRPLPARRAAAAAAVSPQGRAPLAAAGTADSPQLRRASWGALLSLWCRLGPGPWLSPQAFASPAGAGKMMTMGRLPA